MPKIKHIARFTTPVELSSSQPILQATNEQETTPIRRSLPEKLRRHIDQAKSDKVLLVDLIAIILEESTQPLTTIEITKLIETKLGKKMHSNQTRIYLQDLYSQGRVSNRVETLKERFLRANGNKPRALSAHLWWAPAGEVPARTVTEAVPGIILSDPGRKGKVNTKRSKTLVKSYEKSKSNEELPKNPVIDYLIEKMVAERVSSLQEELKSTRAELELLQRKIRNLVGEV